MKLEEKNIPTETKKNTFFTEIPKDTLNQTIPTMKAVFIADVEELEEIDSLSKRP